MKHSFGDRFQYWFDNQMSKGTIALIRLLALVTVGAIALITIALVTFGYSDARFGADIIWDSFATIMNAWMPSYDDGEGRMGYLIIMAVGAIIGILITSVLIGIISTAMEQHIDELKDGKSKVLEKDHIVILGFIPGDYTLIKQVILAAGSKKRTIVIGSDTKCEEMSESVLANVKLPKNVKLIFRSIDIFDPTSLEKCSLATSRQVIISPMDDKKTIKTLLAVSLLINSADNDKVRVSALVYNNEYAFPDTVAAKHNVTTIQLRNTIAKMIALSCTQTGLSDAFRELFGFDGNEFYSVTLKEAVGMSFKELSYRLDDAVPVGILRDGKVILNPDKEYKISDEDQIIVFSEEHDLATITNMDYHEVPMSQYHSTETNRKIAIIGFNYSFKTIFKEMSGDISEVVIAGIPSENRDKVMKLNTLNERTLSFYEEDIDDEDELLELVKQTSHIVVLSDYSLDDEDADIQSIFRIMRLRDLRTRYNLNYNITAELRKNANLNLIREEGHIDYVVASNMASLFLAQLSENYELRSMYKEILSNEGNELHLKKAGDFGCDGVYTTVQLRNLAISNNCVFLGYLKAETYESFFNPSLEDEIQLNAEDSLIVLSED